MPIDGRTWALTEVPMHNINYEEETLGKGPLQRCNPPLVVTQHMEPPRRFVLINSQGSYLMNKLSPADQLKQLLLANNGPNSPEVQAFFKLHQEDQACATCLILACSSLNQAEMQVCDWATRAFFLFGGEPEYNYNMAPATGNTGTSPYLSHQSVINHIYFHRKEQCFADISTFPHFYTYFLHQKEHQMHCRYFNIASI